MWPDDFPPAHKLNIILDKPFVNDPGALGFAPNAHTMPFLSELGAFITHPISRLPRKPAKNRACLPFPGGFLLHTGLPNPGISRAIRQYQRAWSSAPLPVIVHLMAESPNTLAEMIRKLEGLENILALELGLPPHCDPALLEGLMDAAAGELPVLLCLNPEQTSELLGTVQSIQPSAVHLAQPRGTLPNEDGENVTGRLYGPATFPIVLHTLSALIAEDLNVIASGGVFAHWQSQALLDAGAMAIGLGAALWQVDMGDLFTHKNE